MLGFLVDTFEGDRDRALFGYFRSGASIADSLRQVLRWRFGGSEPDRPSASSTSPAATGG